MWNNLCRACLKSKESFIYYLFENISAETYSFCTSIEPKENETLPRAICEECYNLLTRYAEFKRTCIESQNALLCCKTIKEEETQTPLLENEGENCDNDLVTVGCGEIDNNLETKSEDYVKRELSNDSNEELQPPELSDSSVEKTQSRKQKKKISNRTNKNDVNSDIKQEKLSYPCDMCGKMFKYSKRMETHRLGHFNIDVQTQLQCLKCSKKFVTTSGLRRHEASAHAGVRLASVACARCGRVCASTHSLRAHEKTHAAKRPHAVCHVCGKRVSSAIILRAHLETHKSDRERRHTCEHCGKKFYTNTILLSHIKRLHTGLRYICGVCDYPFTDKHNLSKHLLIHEGIKLYKCDICGKSYATNGSLVEHKRIHSGERPFLCSFCPKRFLSKRRLMDHHRTHTGDKPHRCVVCEQRFTQRGTLKRHMKVHDSMKAPLHVVSDKTEYKY